MFSLSVAEYLQASASAIAAVRLIKQGLARRQPALLGFLIFTAVDLVCLARVNPTSFAYLKIYSWGDIVGWFVGFAVIREMFGLAFSGYQGIRTVGRWTLYGSTSLACCVSASITVFFRRRSHHGNELLYVAESVNRSVVLTLAAVLIGIVVVLARYPLHLNRSTYVSTGFFSAVFLSEALTMLIDSYSTLLYSNRADVIQVFFAAFCFLGWALLLRRQAAEAPSARIIFANPSEGELLQQLDSLNRLLSRVGR